jgi:hypothetical protein
MMIFQIPSRVGDARATPIMTKSKHDKTSRMFESVGFCRQVSFGSGWQERGGHWHWAGAGGDVVRRSVKKPV